MEIKTAEGAGFYPSSLTYLMKPNEELCQIVHLTSDSEKITVRDLWGEDENAQWKVSNFQTTSSELDLTLNYPKELGINDRDVEVCVQGSEPGEYRGAIIFRQQQEGSSIIQLAVWLKVVIEGEANQTRKMMRAQNKTLQNLTMEKAGTKEGTNEENENSEIEREQLAGGGVTANVVNENGSRSIWGKSTMFIFGVIVIIAGASIFLYRRKKRMMQYYR